MYLKIPPVVVFLIALSFIFGIYYLLPGLSFFSPYRQVFSSVFLVMGILLGVLGILAFRSKHTTLDPMHPEKVNQLVTNGIYRYTRNPMYLGMAMILVAGLIRLGNPVGILGLLFFVSYITKFQIKPEEEALRRLIREDYLAYCRQVRRWI